MAKGRPGKRALEGVPGEPPGKDYGRQRQLYRSGNSWVVPVPLWARRSIDRHLGGAVYWHEGRAGEIVLTASPTRVGGRTPGEALQRQMARVVRENTLLHRRLRARPTATLHEGANVGAQQMLSVMGLPDGPLYAIARRLDAIEARLPFRRSMRPARRSRPARSVEVAGFIDQVPPPDPSLPVVLVGGGADTSGAEPPGVPRESY